MKTILNSTVYNSSGNCSQLEIVAFNNNQSCYTDNGFCNDILLSDTNLNCIASEVFNFADFWNDQAIRQVCDQ